jgi:ribosomal protein S18 acetylase RimI-like enzyme
VTDTETVRTRVASVADAGTIAQLLIDFNSEYDEPVPGPSWLAGRIAELLGQGTTAVLLLEATGPGSADGLAVMRFRPSLWEEADECYLAELYVRPPLRNRGLGRQLLTAAMRHASERGATYMDLATTNQDTAAVALYESMGFDRHERRGPETTSYYYEIDLPAAGG